ncbi:MAG: UvrD-helicase domain-containing protein [Calothrix sp. FI2-JRJ7]|jgi:DNA helicase-4|nr:UvrD-helicase domain-containing protein [Calothrix sp. FI2-JRJ7]
MNNRSQIDNVQDFVEVIGNNDNLWNLLLNKEVSRFEEKIKYEHTIQDLKGAINSTKGIVIQVNVYRQLNFIRVDYGDGFIFRYQKEQFIQKFNRISPAISLDKIFDCVKKDKDTEKRQEKRQVLFKDLKKYFEQDFNHAYNFYQAKCTQYISFKEYQAEKSNFVQFWIKQYLNSTTDLEQAGAIGAIENHIQVVARAGSGKTSTLVHRALFLQNHCGVAADEILLLAFNRKAAEEIRERLTSKLEDSIPHVMTFHALAYALVHPEESILFDEPDGEQSKSRIVQDNVINRYIYDKALEPVLYEEIRALMMAHFREDWERVILSNNASLKNTQMLRYLRSLPNEGLDGRHYKSFGEKVIANFLFEHNIQYKYERNFWWNGINYRPDFTIGDNQGIIIEYFGIEGNPEYDAMSNQKRDYWQNNPKWDLLEFFPKNFKRDGEKGFCTLLKESLENNRITCERLSEEEIWQRIRYNTINRFTKLVVQFIQRCRKLSLTPAELLKKIDSHECINDVEQRFLKIAYKFYQSYLEYLKTTGKDDFDGLMQKAAEAVASGQTLFCRKSGTGDLKKIRYVMIDEYQDFSDLFYRLITTTQEQNPQANFFCVGDDWQAINGFAGSDLRFYENFGEFFQPSGKINISTNYRSASSIVEIGNTLMQGLGVPARANKSDVGKVEIVDLGTFQPIHKETEEHPGDILTPAILRLVNKVIKEDKEVVLLSRKNSLNSLPWYVNYAKIKNLPKNGKLDNFLKLLLFHLPEEFRHKLTISTAHKYKGLEKKVVIVLDAVPRCYPLLHPDLMFTRVFGDTIERVVEEERRLFYVALTRAIEHLFIITEKNNVSPFLEELQKRKIISTLDWSNYPPLIKTTERIIVRIGNQYGRGSKPTIAIKGLLKAEKYIYKTNVWNAWLGIYPAQSFSVKEFFAKATWISCADGVEVRFYDDLENVLATYHIDKGQLTCIADNIPEPE